MQYNEVCSRCGKSKPIDADADTLMDKINTEKEVKDNVALLEQFIQELGGPLPQLITLHTNIDESGERLTNIAFLEDLCTGDPSLRRNKGCTHRVATLIDDLYRVPRPKPKKNE